MENRGQDDNGDNEDSNDDGVDSDDDEEDDNDVGNVKKDSGQNKVTDGDDDVDDDKEEKGGGARKISEDTGNEYAEGRDIGLSWAKKTTEKQAQSDLISPCPCKKCLVRELA